MDKSNFDLEHRLLVYASRIIKLADLLPKSRAGVHIAKQLLRSGTSPLSNHGEAQAAESRADFIHKMQICLKELRESYRWLKLINLSRLMKNPVDAETLTRETDELIRIFVKSIATAKIKEKSARS